jgi:hypothetical protein
MANGESGYTVKEMLSLLEANLSSRLDRIEAKLDTKANERDLQELEKSVAQHAHLISVIREEQAQRRGLINRFERVETRMKEMDTAALKADGVKEIIRGMLQDSETRGWTTRERMMGVAIFCITMASFALNIWALK